MLRSIHISNLRNITSLHFEPCEGINLFLGENGSGKTSIMEAVHLLALGKSFRTRSLRTVIQFDKLQLQVVAKTLKNIPVGLQYSASDGMKIKLNGLPLRRLSELANEIPLQLIPANCHLFFEQGPRYRRQILDWGLFHVEPNFNLHWQAYKKVLQQRNAALRHKKHDSEITLWDEQLVHHGIKLTEFRQQQLKRLVTEFERLFPILCPEFCNAEFTLYCRTGWKKEQTFIEALNDNLERDKQLGYTRTGPHAADWSIRINHCDPASIFSRGQQKLFFLAICMAQAWIAEKTKRSKSILLVDDICSELDVKHQETVLQQISQLPVQSFITATGLDEKLLKDRCLFHVEQGALR